MGPLLLSCQDLRFGRKKRLEEFFGTPSQHPGARKNFFFRGVMTLECAVCFVTDKPLSRCPRCVQTWYCSASHQRQHWVQHAPNCIVIILKDPQAILAS